jgi:hypothetical protein
MRRRAFVAGLLTGAAAFGRAHGVFAYAAGEAPARADYAILINGSDCGRHSVSVEADGGRCVATIRSTADVRLFVLPLFRYEHLSREIWNGEVLVAFESRTQDNGRSFHVAGYGSPSGFLVEIGGHRATLPPDVAPATYWNRAILERAHVLDPEDGRLFRHRVGTERIAALDWMPAAAEASEVEVTSFTSGVVWYGRSGRFLGCRFRKDNHDIEFRLIRG